jgi:NADH-quinone oxidoreductase subunit G
MTIIYVDGRPYEVDPEQNLLEACLGHGLDLPYFCWHPALGSVGACRQCAVKVFRDENDTRGRLVMSCMTPITEGMRVSIADPEARQFRAGIIEGLMMSHPHDCPVCDEGGECHLQDMTVMTGHNYRRYSYRKRTFRNQYLGPLLNHEMNRCIQCYRCVRYYTEYAGGKDFAVLKLRNLVFFGRFQDGPFENEFAGNLVEVCPTGVFTDRTLKQHYTRKWDLTMAPSVCVHCSVGCNTSAGERYGTLRRIVNRYNGEVNGYFLCDRGRFGYEFVNSPQRVRTPLVREGAALAAASRSAALDKVAALFTAGRVIGIGSPRASVEANFVLRSLVGPENFFAGLPDSELALVRGVLSTLQQGPAPVASLREIETADAALVLGEDVTNTAPRMALSLRQTVRQVIFARAKKLGIPAWQDHAVRELAQDEHGPLCIATPAATRLDDVATETYRAAPDDIARLGFAVAHALDPEAPPVPEADADLQERASRIAAALMAAERPVIVSGTSLGSLAIVRAAAAVATALHRRGRPARIAFVLQEVNTAGLALLEPRPLSEAFAAAGGLAGVLVLENDLFRRAPAEVVERFLAGAGTVVVLDALLTPTAERAAVVLPAASFAEGDGTFVSNEGRAQRYFQVFVPQGDIQESWRWLRDVAALLARPEALRWNALDDVIDSVVATVPVLAGIRRAAPPASFRIAGAKIPRQPHRYSGRTAMLAHITVHEPKPPDDPDSALAFSMEGASVPPPPPLLPFFWTPGWNSIQSVNKFQQEIAGPLRAGDPGVRLLEPTGSATGYRDAVPAAFRPRPGQFLLLRQFHIFGSEELSAAAPAIAELATKPYVGLAPADAAALGVGEGTEVRVRLRQSSCRLPVRLFAELKPGLALLPHGLAPATGWTLPEWGVIEREP